MKLNRITPPQSGNDYVVPDLDLIVLKTDRRILDGSLGVTTENIDPNEDTFDWDNQE